MTTWSVDSSTLQFYVNAAVQSGDTLALAPGVYSGLTFNNLLLNGVTITSADPNHHAVLNDFTVANSSGLTFSNLELATGSSVNAPSFNVSNSNDIHFDHVSVHGSLDHNPQNDAYGFGFTGSANISVTNSEFQQLGRALQASTSSNVVITGNTVHDIRIDGFDFAQVDHVTVRGNSFTNFHPVTGDHADAIQFWTTGTTAASHDIEVSGNVILRGDGEAMQGVFMRDGLGTLPFQNVTISDNVMYGTPFNGIRVIGADHLTISGNKLTSVPGKATWTKIDVQMADHVTLLNNDAMHIDYDHVTNLVESGDTINLGVTDLGAATLQAFSQLHPELSASLAAFVPAAAPFVVVDNHPLVIDMPHPFMEFGGAVTPMAFVMGPIDFSFL